ncbi:hypothetical protein ACSXEK_15605 (plasmid) [Clostridium perfringens]
MKKLRDLFKAKNITEIILRVFGVYSFIMAIGYLFDLVVLYKFFVVWLLVFMGYIGLFGEYDRDKEES